MKILMVNDYKEKIAGTEIYMYHIMNELQKKGHTVMLFSSKITLEEYYSPQYNKSFKKYIVRLFNIDSYRKFKKIIKAFNPDIIHVHNMYNELSPSILFGLENRIVVMTVHGSQMISPVSLQTERTGNRCKSGICEGCTNCVGLKGTIYETVKRTIYKRLLKKISLYIAPSDYLKDVLENKQYKPVIRLYNGIPLLSFSNSPMNSSLLYVGRITREKGIEVLVRAFKSIIQTIPEVRLTIIGEGPYLQEIAMLIQKLQLGKYITLTGGISSQNISSYYKKATLIVIPSIYPDNLPTVGLESLSVGRPVIGSNIGGIPDLVKNDLTGYLVKPDDVSDLSKIIVKTLKDKKKLHNMSENSRMYAEREFDISQHVTKLEKIYKNLLKQKK